MNYNPKTITKEPYINLNVDNFSQKKKLFYGQIFRQRSKYNFYQKAFDFLSVHSIKGAYLEFGCHRARTFRFALREAYLRSINMDFYAFDSFQGLPDHKNNTEQNINFRPKALYTSKNEFLRLISLNSKLIKKRKIEIFKGFYEDILNKNLIIKLKKTNLKASFICIDCDLVDSVKKSLDFALNFFVNGTILYIDDYYTTYKGDPRIGIPKEVKKILYKKKIFSEPYETAIASCGKSFLLYK
jgi:O-methyltransferase